ncbi:MAG: CHAT domain-containing protein/tetratricopeptide (TPR) repeat protein [Chlamydiales bacterium]|jgi:CHAT domain-containing protein/tetratricopeptide (TPR) repeat protein
MGARIDRHPGPERADPRRWALEACGTNPTYWEVQGDLVAVTDRAGKQAKGRPVEYWIERLTLDAGAAGSWADFEALDDDERVRIAAALKSEVDGLIRSDPPHALVAADVLHRAAQSTPAVQAVAARGRAMAKHANGRAVEALGDYLEAARLHTEDGDEIELGRVHRSLVDVYQMSGDVDQAMLSADTAREIFERLHEPRLLAQLEANLGNVFVRLDDYPAARAHYGEACRRFTELEDELSLAVAGYNLGVVETNANAVPEARGAFLASRLVFHAKGMRVHTADCDYMLAYLEARRGRFGQAIRDLENARELYADCGKPSGGPMCDLDLAEIYYRIDACRDAAEHARSAMRGFEALDMDYEFAKSSLFAGLAYARLGERQSALDAMTTAREILTRLGNRAWPAVLDIHRSVVELEARPGSPELPGDGALERLHSARSALEEQGLQLWSDLATVALARLHLARGDSRAARSEVASLDHGQDERAGLDALVTLERRMLLAEVCHVEGNRAGAIAALRLAVKAIESTWSNVPGTDVRIAFFRTRHDAFARLALLLAADDGSHADAFEVLERGRLRSLREERDGSLPGEEFRRARERLDWLLGRQLDEQLGPAAGDREVKGGAVTDADILELQKEVARLGRSVDRQLPSGGSGEPIAPHIAERLATDEAFITWVVVEDEAYALLVNSKGVCAYPLSVDDRQLRELGDRLFFQMHKFELGPEYQARHQDRLLRSVNGILDELGELVLGPLRHALAGCTKLVLVPYGALHGLPLHALRLEGQPLIATHDVGYALSGYQLLKARQTRPSVDRGQVTVVACDEQSLPAIAQEVRAILQRYPDQAHSLDSTDLRARLEEAAPKGGLLHVSAHGAFRPEHPVFSGLRLGSSFLTAHDVARLSLQFELVNLSGCETGRLGHTPGEEVFGLNRAFLGAGTRCVVSSLWPVADADCAAFMGCFYDHLAAGADARAAISAAQRERLLVSPHPFAWASFAGFGDTSVCIPAR